VADLAKLMAGSKAKYGARYQRRVAEGYNVFGPSDYYISVYRGWIRIPKAGKYRFCTVSNEASFSFLDGKELVHWPGRHTVDRGIRGEVNALVELSAGLHYLEYYHEEVTLDQMAYLGWRPSADEGAFSPIPESIYTAPHEAVVSRYESPKGPLLRFEPVITDSVWLADRSEGQFTRCRFAAGKTPALPAGTKYEWDFGDGQKASGAEVDHVYLTLGMHTVTLTASNGSDKWTASWPLLIFEIEHVTDQFKEGRPKDYARLVKDYDKMTLSAEALKELAYLLAEAEDPAGALAVGKVFVKRFEKKANALLVARVRRLMADCAIRLGEGKLADAVENYQAALIKEMPAVEKLEVLTQLIRLLGLERKLPDKAAGILEQVEKVVKAEGGLDRDTRTPYRRALIAMGDVRLEQGKRTEAQKLYTQAEKLHRAIIPSQVRAARIGAYPNSLREYLGAGNYGAALDLVDQWDETFPTDKLNGQTFFWRGKVLVLRGQPRDAVRYLELAVRIARGAGFETEARWHLAEALEQLGRKDAARKELAKLIATGLNDEYTKRAKEKLKK
jgi:tetratricopeptide (TPR) repeat protein